jgi:hypothetical protein
MAAPKPYVQAFTAALYVKIGGLQYGPQDIPRVLATIARWQRKLKRRLCYGCAFPEAGAEL